MVRVGQVLWLALPVILGGAVHIAVIKLDWLGALARLPLDGGATFRGRRLLGAHKTVRGAVLDSWADLATYASLPPSAWWLRPGFVRAEAIFLLVAVASYVAPVAIGFLRYGRLTSYHTRGAKLAAYLGGASALVVFAGGPALPFRLATAVLVLAEL